MFFSRLIAIMAIILSLLVGDIQGLRAQVGELDLQMLVDVSDRTTGNDDQQTRYGALRLLLELLPESGYAAIWGYGETVTPLVQHGRSNTLWKTQAALLTSALPGGGNASDLNAALEQAMADGIDATARERHVLVISDGAIGPADNPAEGQTMAATLTTTLSGRLRAQGYRVSVLLLPAASDQASFESALQDLSVQTGGRSLRVVDFGSLEFALAALLDALIAQERLPIAPDQGFVVEQGLDEMTLLRLRQPGDEILTLTDPGGSEYTRLTPNIGFRWQVGANYDLVTFQHPRGGRWYLAPEAAAQAIVLARGGITPRILGLPAMIFPGELKTFALEMGSASGRITDRQFLDLLEIEADVISPSGRSAVPVQMTSDGQYQLQLLAAENQGDYRLQVRVRGPTFERIVTIPFSIRNPISLRLMPDSGAGTVWFTMTAADIVPEQMQVQAVATRPMLGAEPLEVTKFPGGLWKVALSGAPGLVELTLDITGKQLNGNSFSIQTKPVVITQPVLTGKYYSFAIDGSERGNRLIIDVDSDQATGAADILAETTPDPLKGPVEQAQPEFELPLWFVAALAPINLLVGFAVFFLLTLPGIPERFFDALGQLQTSLETADSPPEEPATG